MTSEPQRAWTGTGHHQEVPGQVDRIPDFDTRTGDHLWIIITTYQWGGPTVERPTLDGENLLAVQGPCCYHCEEPWSERLAKRRCPGHPRH